MNIETKFSVHDKVFVVEEGKIERREVSEVRVSAYVDKVGGGPFVEIKYYVTNPLYAGPCGQEHGLWLVEKDMHSNAEDLCTSLYKEWDERQNGKKF